MARELTEMSLEQKRALYRDGFVVLKQIVPRHLTAAARRVLAEAETSNAIAKGGGTAANRPNLTGAPELTDLINKSPLTPLMRNTMGYFDPPRRCQVAVVHPSRPSSSFRTGHGYREKDMPYRGWVPHCDGLFGAMMPPEVQAGVEEVRARFTPEQVYERVINAAPRAPNLGRRPEVIGTNFVPLFEDPAMTLSLGSFTALVGVCLSDQTAPGRGQLGLLKGGHHATQRFFRKQRASAAGIIGPEGEGWPRFDYTVPAGCGTVSLPQEVRDEFVDGTSECTPDGRRWPRPTLIMMEEGDAVVTLYHTPHSGTRNESREPRQNIYFRLRNKAHQPKHFVNGLTDHPDRGYNGEWLEYEEGNDPWETSKHHMCNMWELWEGMAEVVAESERAPRL